MSEHRRTADAVWAELVRRHDEHVATHGYDGTVADHNPVAAVLACSDARVPPSVLFGQDAGSLFVVRIAGSSATAGAVASLTFAVEHLGCGLVVVLGHTNCGAVRAALDDSPDPVLAPVLAPILAPIDEMLAACRSCDGDLDAAVAANVAHNLRRLRRNRGPLGNAIAEGRAVLRGAVHDLATGRLVEITEEGPAGESPALSVPIP